MNPVFRVCQRQWLLTAHPFGTVCTPPAKGVHDCIKG
nr:MAG TPA: hypothetical protein [Caudoviricetes sp.]